MVEKVDELLLTALRFVKIRAGNLTLEFLWIPCARPLEKRKRRT